MPTSFPVFNDLIAHHVKTLAPEVVLDIGPGSGKYGKIVRENIPTAALIAVEPTASYINEFGLSGIYDTVHNMRVQDFMVQHVRHKSNLVVIGDVLEHLFRSEVIDVLDFMLYRTDWLMALWPTNLPQNDEYENNAYEAHKSNFKLPELAALFDVHYYEKKFAYFLGYNSPEYNACEYHYCLLRGYDTRRNMGL